MRVNIVDIGHTLEAEIDLGRLGQLLGVGIVPFLCQMSAKNRKREEEK